MRNHLRRAVFLGLSAAIFLPVPGFAQTPPDVIERIEQADKELWELQTKIDELHLRMPSCNPEEEEKWLRGWATKGGELSAIEVKSTGSEQLRFSDGQPADFELVRFEISGRDPYEKVHAFLIRLARRHRLIDLERLHLKVDAGGTVLFTGRLALPCFKQAPEEESEWTGIEDVVAKIVEHRRETYQKLTELTERSNAGRFSTALVMFGDESGKRAVALTEARLIGEEIVLEGVLYGAAAQASLGPALETAGFSNSQVKLSPTDECQKFSIAAHLERREQELKIVIENGLFDDETASFCKMPPSAGRVVAQGTSTSPDAITLRLRDADLVDIFLALNDLTPYNFVIDADVKGRVSVDIAGATLEEALAAMSSAGVTVGPGPWRRISRAGSRPVPARSSYEGETLDVRVENAALVHILCTFEQILERPVLGPPDLDGSVCLFVDNLPWDQVLDGLLSSVGLTFALEEKRLLIGPGPESSLGSRSDLVSVCQIPVTRGEGSRLASISLRLEDLNTTDVTLAGMARKGDTWKAYTYSPSRRLVELKPGQKLLDGSITAVGPEGVSIETHGGAEAVTVSFRP